MNQQPTPNPEPAQITIPAIEFGARAYLLRQRQVLRRVERVLERDPVLRAEIESLGGLATALTSDPLDPISLAYTNRFLSFQNTAALAQFFPDIEVPIPSAQEMAQSIGEILKIATDTASELNHCCEEIKDLLRKLDNKLDQQYIDRTKYFDEKAIEIIDKTSEEIVNSVAGESYYRVIATTTFMPTLVMVFNEATENKIKRRAQLKFKIDKTSEEIDEEFVEKLRKTFRELKQRYFFYGKTRITYVSSDKRIRNVMFARDYKEGVNLLEFVYPLLDQEFDENNLSYTLGRNRAVFNKRKKPLFDVEPLDLDYDKECRMELKRVIIQIAGLGKPILIFRRFNV